MSFVERPAVGEVIRTPTAGVVADVFLDWATAMDEPTDYPVDWLTYLRMHQRITGT